MMFNDMPAIVRHGATALFAFFAISLFPQHLSAGSNELRSAYLGPDVWAENLSASDVNGQLKNHFDRVLKTLQQNRQPSLLLALRRAEATSNQPWNPTLRRQALIELAANRQKQVVRLEAYAKLGVFPLNEGQAASAVPIFVDRHDTHCAVGYLMHVDGADRQVSEIVTGNNLIRVMDAKSNGLVDWIRTSGLTQEEAALIQPGYPINLDASLREFLTTQPVFNNGDFTLSEVTFRRVELDIDSSTNATSAETVQTALQEGRTLLENAEALSFGGQAGVLFGSTGDSLIPGLDEFIQTPPSRLEDFLYFGPSDAIFGTLLGGREGTFADGFAQVIGIDYLLRANGGRFSDFGLSFGLSFENDPSSGVGSLNFVSEIFDGNTNELLGTTESLRVAEPFQQGSGETPTVSVDTDFLRIRTIGMTLAEDASGNEPEVHSVFFDFSVTAVPEPSGLAPLAFVAICGALRRKTKQRLQEP